MSEIINNQKHFYRYRLSDNSINEKAQINGVDLTRSWMTSDVELKQLNSYIRTKDAPDNFIDYEKFDRFSNAVLKSSWVDFTKLFPYYERNTLASMKRPQLELICNSYNISTANMRNDILINKVLEKQEFYKSQHDERKRLDKEKELDRAAEKAMRKIFAEHLDVVITDAVKDELKQKLINDLKKSC